MLDMRILYFSLGKLGDPDDPGKGKAWTPIRKGMFSLGYAQQQN